MENKKISFKIYKYIILSITTFNLCRVGLGGRRGCGDQCGGYGMAPDFFRLGARHDHSGPGALLRRDGAR